MKKNRGKGHRRGRPRKEGLRARVVATRGRRVLVRNEAAEEVVCFLSGHRAVIGDEVLYVEAKGTGGKIVEVLDRTRELLRVDFKGREQVVANGLGGLLVVASAAQPAYRPGLMDRYQVAAGRCGIDFGLVLTKADLGISPQVEADLEWRASLGVPIFRTIPTQGVGVTEVLSFLEDASEDGPWALVGHSGVGKTSLTAALLPGEDVGPIGEVSTFWDTGRHTTTGSRIFSVGERGEIVDSPGIRTFLPAGLTPETVRDYFPGVGRLGCQYRDCLHRPGEEGCVAEEEVPEDTLLRYRRMLDEVVSMKERLSP